MVQISRWKIRFPFEESAFFKGLAMLVSRRLSLGQLESLKKNAKVIDGSEIPRPTT